MCIGCNKDFTWRIKKLIFCCTCFDIISCTSCRLNKTCECNNKSYYFSALTLNKKKQVLNIYHFKSTWLVLHNYSKPFITAVANLLDIDSLVLKSLKFEVNNANYWELEIREIDNSMYRFIYDHGKIKNGLKNNNSSISGDNCKIVNRMMFGEVVRYNLQYEDGSIERNEYDYNIEFDDNEGSDDHI